MVGLAFVVLAVAAFGVIMLALGLGWRSWRTGRAK
jgi:hypothetical protein